MKTPVLSFLFVLLFINAKAHSKDSTISYPIVVKFQSSCCGVPEETLLRKAIKKFKKKQHLKYIASYHIGPMGREGEYIVAFPLLEMKQKQQLSFINIIKKTVPLLKNKGYAEYEQYFSRNLSALPTRATITKLNY